MYITTCEMDDQSSLKHQTGHSKPVHWDNPEGWDGEGGERGLGTGATCTAAADSCQCMEKKNTTILLSN